MDCRVKPCNDGSWAKYRSIHALYSPTRSPSPHGLTMGSIPMPLGQTAAPTGMVKTWFAGGEPWKDRSQVRCNFASIGN